MQSLRDSMHFLVHLKDNYAKELFSFPKVFDGETKVAKGVPKEFNGLPKKFNAFPNVLLLHFLSCLMNF